MNHKYRMYLMLLLLSIAVHSVHSQQQQPSDYTRNSVFYAGKVLPTVPTSTEQSSQDVLKELGVDLSNEGKTILVSKQLPITEDRGGYI